jgi:hypothetical protein
MDGNAATGENDTADTAAVDGVGMFDMIWGGSDGSGGGEELKDGLLHTWFGCSHPGHQPPPAFTAARTPPCSPRLRAQNSVVAQPKKVYGETEPPARSLSHRVQRAT